MPGEFLDSNVLLYVTSSDSTRAARAEELIGRRPSISVQVLNEVANVTRRKYGRSWREISAFLGDLVPLLNVHSLTEPIHRDALIVVERYQLAWWDALIVSAALSVGCETLYSEDMHHGLIVDGRLTIVNPFLG